MDFFGVTSLEGLAKLCRLVFGGTESGDDMGGISQEDADPKVFFARGDAGCVFQACAG